MAENLVYIDESGVDKSCYNQKGWGKIGETLLHEISGKRIKRTSVLAALNQKNILAPLFFKGTCNTDLFIEWTQQQLVPSLTKGQTVIMDNASIHKSPKVRELIQSAGCKLIYLPPYSPDLNPIETFWANMKKWIKNNVPDISNTWDALTQFFNAQTST